MYLHHTNNRARSLSKNKIKYRHFKLHDPSSEYLAWIFWIGLAQTLPSSPQNAVGNTTYFRKADLDEQDCNKTK